MTYEKTPDFSLWRPIHYLGSKLRIAAEISAVVASLRSPSGAVCDLFAGSGTMAFTLAEKGPVVASDIQEYSRVICSSLLVEDRTRLRDTSSLINSHGLHSILLECCEPLIEYEHFALLELSKGRAEGLLALQNAMPLQLEVAPSSPKLSIAITETRRRLASQGLDQIDATTTLRHFGGSYFSIKQSVDLTGLLYGARLSQHARDTHLAVILSVASDVVNSVGKHFAQPLKLTNASGESKPQIYYKTLSERSINVLDLHKKWSEKYQSKGDKKFGNTAIRSDFRDTLKEKCSGVEVVYADPPYGREHYSRYYHVLETMALGDSPLISANTSKRGATFSTGAYRSDRHQSPFCIRSTAPEAFDAMFRHTKKLRAALVLSYSAAAAGSKPRQRVVELDDLVGWAKNHFAKVVVQPISHVEHAKLNKRSLNSTHKGSELIIVCTN